MATLADLTKARQPAARLPGTIGSSSFLAGTFNLNYTRGSKNTITTKIKLHLSAFHHLFVPVMIMFENIVPATIQNVSIGGLAGTLWLNPRVIMFRMDNRYHRNSRGTYPSLKCACYSIYGDKMYPSYPYLILINIILPI